MDFYLCESASEVRMARIFSENPRDLLDIIIGTTIEVDGIYFVYIGHELVIEKDSVYCYVELERKH